MKTTVAEKTAQIETNIKKFVITKVDAFCRLKEIDVCVVGYVYFYKKKILEEVIKIDIRNICTRFLIKIWCRRKFSLDLRIKFINKYNYEEKYL